jgi:hypothetical protein
MSGGYYIEFSLFPLSQLQERICNSILIPSHRILLEEIQPRFEALNRLGVVNLEDLFSRCSTAKKMNALAAEATIPEEYLVILNRHAGVYRPQPNDLSKIPGLNGDYLAALIALGLKNTRSFWEAAITREMRENLADQTGLPAEFLYEVACHSDLTRAGYVGPVFSRLLYESGAKTIRKLAGYDPKELFELTLEVNREKQYTRVGYLLKDIAWCVDYARLLPWVLEED